jgi:hypothetical protein
MDTDTDKQINSIKKLIATASGDMLIYYNQLLSKLLENKANEELTKEASNQKEDTQVVHNKRSPVNAFTELRTDKVIRIIQIEVAILSDVFLHSDGVANFMNKCIEPRWMKLRKIKKHKN